MVRRGCVCHAMPSWLSMAFAFAFLESFLWRAIVLRRSVIVFRNMSNLLVYVWLIMYARKAMAQKTFDNSSRNSDAWKRLNERAILVENFF